MKEKFDKTWLGLVLGILLPPISSYVVYLWFNKTNSYLEFMYKLQVWGIRTEVLLWCLLPISFVFALFYFLHYDNASKGVVLPTMIYTIILLILDSL